MSNFVPLSIKQSLLQHKSLQVVTFSMWKFSAKLAGLSLSTPQRCPIFNKLLPIGPVTSSVCFLSAKRLRNHLCFAQSQTTAGMLPHNNTALSCILSAKSHPLTLVEVDAKRAERAANQPFLEPVPKKFSNVLQAGQRR